MKCDSCNKDVCFLTLQWDGRYVHNDTLLYIHKRKRTICKECWELPINKYIPKESDPKK